MNAATSLFVPDCVQQMNSATGVYQKRKGEPKIKVSVPANQSLTLVKLFLACLYGFLLASLPINEFQDRSNYFEYIDASDIILERHFDKGFITTLANEPLWLLINIVLRTWFQPDTALRVIIFVPAFLVSFLALRHQRKEDIIWVILFLFLQPILKNHIIHLRQGTAVSIFLLGWSVKSKSLKCLLFSMTPLIHSSFFFVLALKILLRAFRLVRFSTSIRFVSAIFLGGVLAWNLVFIGQSLGARQVLNYNYGVGDISGIGFLIWSIILALFTVQTGSFRRLHVFEISTIGFYLGTYFITQITARIFESGLMLVMLAGLELPLRNKRLFQAVLIVYYGLGYFLSRKQPWFGFGLTNF